MSEFSQNRMTPSVPTHSVAASSEAGSLADARETLLTIKPGRSAILRELKEAWEHRELLYFLIWRDLKVRYRQTVLGVAWVVLQPLLMTLVFTVFFSKLGHFRSDGVPYPIFAYAGLLPWTFFSNSISTGSSSLLANSYIITKVYFPRLLVPTAIVVVRLVDLLVASLVLIAILPFYGMGIGRSMLLLPVIIAEATILSLAVSYWLSVLSVRYRDVGTLLPVLIQLWMFASPIIYPSSLVPDNWRRVYALNPLVGIIEGFRASFLGLPFRWNAILVSAAITLVFFINVLYAFYRWEDRVMDKL